jgi:tetratricopeptide (TPR) repeat protein
MQMLDLANDDPQEYCGKGIVIDGCTYEIGPELRSESATVIHVLKNVKSGLNLSVIAIRGVGTVAKSEFNREISAKAMAHALGIADIVPNIMMLKAGGALLYIKDYIGPYESVQSPARKVMSAGDSLARNGKWQEAADAYGKVLAAYPFHTVALNNMAYALERMNRMPEALQAQTKAVSIEPNYLPYLRALVGYAAAAGYLRYAVESYRNLKGKYDYDESRDSLAIEACLAIGQPEQALEIDEKKIYGNRDAGLTQRITLALRAKEKSLSTVKKAKESLFGGSLESALDLLRKAYESYDSDPMLRVNLGLLLAANGEYDKAKGLLLSSVTNVPSKVAVSCLLNAAFACVRAGLHEEGIKLIAAGMQEFAWLAEKGSGAQVDLPSMAYWIDDEGSLEAPYIDTLQIVAELIEKSPPQMPVPESVVQLVTLYQELATAEVQNP